MKKLTGAVDGVHQDKAAQAVTDFGVASMGALIAQLAKNEKGSKFTVEAGLRFVGGNIDGAITVKGTGRNSSAKNADDFTVGLYTGDFVFGQNATFTQVYQTAGYPGSLCLDRTGHRTLGKLYQYGSLRC